MSIDDSDAPDVSFGQILASAARQQIKQAIERFRAVPRDPPAGPIGRFHEAVFLAHGIETLEAIDAAGDGDRTKLAALLNVEQLAALYLDAATAAAGHPLAGKIIAILDESRRLYDDHWRATVLLNEWNNLLADQALIDERAMRLREALAALRPFCAVGADHEGNGKPAKQTGGRPRRRKWEKLWAVIQGCDKRKPQPSDAKIASEYNQKNAAKIGIGKGKLPKAKACHVKNVRHRYGKSK